MWKFCAVGLAVERAVRSFRRRPGYRYQCGGPVGGRRPDFRAEGRRISRCCESGPICFRNVRAAGLAAAADQLRHAGRTRKAFRPLVAQTHRARSGVISVVRGHILFTVASRFGHTGSCPHEPPCQTHQARHRLGSFQARVVTRQPTIILRQTKIHQHRCVDILAD
jgi:hypothetical protein